MRTASSSTALDRFEAGADGAQPGVAMPADPVPGLSYRQEYYNGQAEDKGAIVPSARSGSRCRSATSPAC